MSLDTFRAAVMAFVGAADAPNCKLIFDAWATQESGSDQMRWNNPLNTTQWEPGAVDMNSVGVKSYPDEQTGITATVNTLLNGYYNKIVGAFVADAPASVWRADSLINHELNTWGTGPGFLSAVPDATEVEDLDSVQAQQLDEIHHATVSADYGAFGGTGGQNARTEVVGLLNTVLSQLSSLQAQVAALTPPVTSADTPTPLPDSGVTLPPPPQPQDGTGTTA